MTGLDLQVYYICMSIYNWALMIIGLLGFRIWLFEYLKIWTFEHFQLLIQQIDQFDLIYKKGNKRVKTSNWGSQINTVFLFNNFYLGHKFIM